MILRIEDTDQNRFVPGAEEYIVNSLAWCGIDFDESPSKGGPHAPYRQSERSAIYRGFAETLLSAGHAYYAFDTEEELENIREKYKTKENSVFQYDQKTRLSLRNSLSLSPEETKALLESGTSYVVRIKIPEDSTVTLQDLIRGEVTVHTSNLDDKVLFKSDGLPTYHLANVADDYLMEITHVIRGEEWLPSAPLHVLLYRFLGIEEKMPRFAHLPLILKPDGNGKLSKRDGDRLGFPVFPTEWRDPKSGEVYSGYREAGYLPQAMINILAHLGWNPGTEQEVFTMEDLIEQFSLERVGKHGARFDPEKAKWFNHQYILGSSAEELAEYLLPYLEKNQLKPDHTYIHQVINLIRDRASLLTELWAHSWFFFMRPENYDQQVFQKIWQPATSQLISDFSLELSSLEPFNKDTLHDLVQTFTQQNGIKTGQLMNPLRLLAVGSNQGPGMMDIAFVLGKPEFQERIRLGLNKIGI
jgi:glutamyl-tRNA synthetase